MAPTSEIFFLPYVLDLINMLEQKICRDSNLRVKLMYESVNQDVLSTSILRKNVHLQENITSKKKKFKKRI